jgi:hypothetical protein
MEPVSAAISNPFAKKSHAVARSTQLAESAH